MHPLAFQAHQRVLQSPIPGQNPGHSLAVLGAIEYRGSRSPGKAWGPLRGPFRRNGFGPGVF